MHDFYSTMDIICVNNRKLNRLEPLTTVQLDIAPRSQSFYSKRDQTQNPAYQPSGPKAIQHDDMLRLAVSAFNTTYFLHLHPNTDLFHPNAVINYNGREERLKRHEYRVYRGYVVDETQSHDRWVADRAGVLRDDFAAENEAGVLGWARIVVRDDISHDLDYPVFEGSFRVHDNIYHVKATHNYQLAKRSDDVELNTAHHQSRMVIYRDSDTVLTPLLRRDGQPTTQVPECGFDQLLHNQQPPSTIPAHHALGVYQDNELDIDTYLMMPDGHSPLRKRAPEGCPSTKKINYMGAAADCTYTKFYQSADNARKQIINDWNTASAVYERTFNIQLGLINITIMDENCPSTPQSNASWNQGCSSSYTISSRLSDFSQWRATLGDDGAGLWHLMTACASGVEVGIAWLRQLCTHTVSRQQSQEGTQYVSGTAVSSIIRDEWTVVAHEIGHNFGAIHDCTSDNCPCSGSSCQCCPLSSSECDAQGRYLMNPSSNGSTHDFSPCTINTVCEAFPSLGSCLEDPGSRTIKTLQMCGNGIKEDGEDCDTGGTNTTCCNGSTCKFNDGAKCEDSTDLCCDNCQPRASGFVCRAATSECDVEETCPGDTGDCPSDQHKQDGESCSNGMQCASGQCTSRDAQCKQRGSDMKIARACGSASGSCQMICDNPNGLGCIIFNGFFLDGTPCGIGGTCKDGTCSLDNFGDNAKNWIDNHKEIVIPVAIVVGLLVLFCIFRCCCMSYYRRRNGGVYVIGGTPQQPPPPPYYPPPQAQWVDPSRYNGAPSMPPPSYTPPTREAYEMNSSGNWQQSQQPENREGGDISGRVQRFQEQQRGSTSPR
ncbi:zinc metalloprotease [Lichtheimia corymbifera JMRC:FSU:9682]|uniref:Disintegrin and metalloproteinase domain-containing protein B n=1 Tax=Lichtheimia corymbifera JMRC:FSU:9682 TaxID=1263082 RepID=A0A068S4Z2_9FUNG|nr:zinc metalloprotease [Lichtheimia corymbifera JMRC:FSU:9682]